MRAGGTLGPRQLASRRGSQRALARARSDRITGLSTNEAAAELGLPVATVKRWVDEAGIPVPKTATGARRFDDEALGRLRQVQQLLGDGRHLKSIRVILAPEASSQAGANQSPDQREPVCELARAGDVPPAATPNPQLALARESARASVDLEEVANSVGDRVAAQLIDVVRHQVELAGSLATAARRVGELEATVAHRDIELANVGLERDRLAGELADARQLLATTPARPWWRPW